MPCIDCFTDKHKKLFLYTDTSKIGLSGTLMVRNVEGHWPRMFHSQKLSGAEVNCGTIELELLAKVDSL